MSDDWIPAGDFANSRSPLAICLDGYNHLPPERENERPPALPAAHPLRSPNNARQL